MKSKSMEEHREKAPAEIRCGVITLSDSKFEDYQKTKDKSSDISGKLLFNALQSKYVVENYIIIPDDTSTLLSTIHDMIENSVDIIITTGGTGIGSRDITVETLQPLFEKELDGFGEIFRLESYKDLGIGAILSRATAGVYKKTLIFALPGSPNAVKLGINLILDEIGHLAKHLKE
ncbi:MogA/MoaB family molybdenum cofactor biosynthesis protein [Methanobacterium alcaliphilum]|uniref:MogA/MoaB family molybdenum cofactor biosynthesis protein n=1 Tax=Methanobacterium alcaliphilum TaxID=392018 RepID=UPI00200A8103|nr:molybdenum cofactor biosynthesis protein B [Methanobacterium alcaliphilum]MCK9151247.1 molybdenum cofactor biosynthesis protein MoaB [Methanobacterium alcaliphilum]